MEQRQHPRLNAVDMAIDMAIDTSATAGFSTGTLKDVSRLGICIADIPSKLFTKDRQLTVVISVNRQLFKLQVTPKWAKQDEHNELTGAMITGVPSAWTEMILQMEPENDTTMKNY